MEDIKSYLNPSLEESIELYDLTIVFDNPEHPTTAKYIHIITIKNTSLNDKLNWSYIVPSNKQKINNINVKDSEGALEYSLEVINGDKTKLSFLYRKPIGPQQSYKFTFVYETEIDSFFIENATNKTVVWNEFIICNCPIQSLKVKFKLPENARSLIRTIPPSKINFKTGRIELPIQTLRPLEYFSFHVFYEVRAFSIYFWFWIIWVVVVVFFGYLLAAFLFQK